MLKDQPQELGAGNGSGLHLLCLAVLIPKGYLVILAGHDVLLLDHALVEITAKIDQRLLTRADGLHIHH